MRRKQRQYSRRLSKNKKFRKRRCNEKDGPASMECPMTVECEEVSQQIVSNVECNADPTQPTIDPNLILHDVSSKECLITVECDEDPQQILHDERDEVPQHPDIDPNLTQIIHPDVSSKGPPMVSTLSADDSSSNSTLFLPDCIASRLVAGTAPVTSTPISAIYDCCASMSIHSDISTIERHSLTIEASDELPPFSPVGRVVVDIGCFLSQLGEAVHHPGSQVMGCSFRNIQFTGDYREGLHYKLFYICTMCNFKGVLNTDNRNDGKMDVNTSSVSGAIAAGIGHHQMEEIMGTLNIPFLSDKSFIRYEEKIRDALLAVAVQEMSCAAEEEKRYALEMGDVDDDGTPLITVVADGSWAKRSYKTKYDSLSGTAAIMGCRTQKVLFLAVRNKYCTVCARAENKEIDVREHRCYKNWTGSSSAMETSIILEGFQRSMEMYGIKYNKFIADGDASVYNELIKKRPYKDLPITKIECTNHLLRNYCRKFRALADNTKVGSKQLRLGVARNIIRLRGAVNSAAKHWQNQPGPLSERTSRLRNEIVNSPFHIFGRHDKCDQRYCQGAKPGEIDLVPSLTSAGIWSQINEIVKYLARHSNSLIQRLTSNMVENFNSRLAKMTGGKRINYCSRGSYTTRCMSAVVSHNTSTLQSKLHRTMYKSSPGYYVKRMEAKRRLRTQLKQRVKNKTKKPCQKKLQFDKETSDYGPAAKQPDMPEHEFDQEVEEFLSRLKLEPEAARKLEEATIEQCGETLWVEERRKRLTASNFGKVIKRRPTTYCEKLVKELLYRNYFDTPSMKYGRETEEEARLLMGEMLGVDIRRCGLFIDQEYAYLGASPDGLIGNDGIAEFKCPHTLKDMSPIDIISQGKFPFLKLDGDTIVINKQHNFYFQIQGQLNITKRSKCYFGLYSKTEPWITIVEIDRDVSVWECTMLPKLTLFYMNCLIPELIDPRNTRSMNIREPEHILQAIQEKNSKSVCPIIGEEEEQEEE